MCAVAAIFFLIAGASDGIVQTILFHYSYFKQKFPKASDFFWYPGDSWRNKYKNSDPEQGARFFGSTTFFAWITDGYHLFRTLTTVFFLAGSVIFWLAHFDNILLSCLAYLGLFYAFRAIGFHAVYSAFFAKNKN